MIFSKQASIGKPLIFYNYGRYQWATFEGKKSGHEQRGTKQGNRTPIV